LPNIGSLGPASKLFTNMALKTGTVRR